MRLLILFGLIALLTPVIGHSQAGHDTTYYSKKIKKVAGKVLLNRTIGIADTTYALIKGQVFDNENKEVQSEIIIKCFQSKEQMTVDTDEYGKFNFYVPAETYSVTFKQSGHGNLTIDTLSLTSGQIREINVSLGSRFIVQEWRKVKDDTITIKSKRNLGKTSKQQ